ncbi:hypothetical protein [Enterobacter kobei]|uniref:hypothetical protein n=1 Tax=Enterobacter kobei TaxID=208224 RepID=UPI001EDD5CBC|nr:hypothetical protein [Enterobacter kobei]
MSNIDKRPFRADGGDISTGRLKEIADNPYGDEEKCWLAKRVIALQAELEASQSENERLAKTLIERNGEPVEGLVKRVAELEEIATDYGMKFQRAQDALKHQSLLHKSQLEAAEKRIAELEALEVKLPNPHAHLIWIQAGHAPDDYWDDVAVSHSEKDKCCDGSDRYPVYTLWEIKEALSAIGINIAAAGKGEAS